MASRMNAPTALRQGNLTLMSGSLNRPALRWAKEPGSGISRLAAGYTAIVINRFRALEVGQNDTMVRSNAAGAGNVAPLAFARANATTADGQETAIDGYEVAARIGRLSLYRQTATKNGWRLYGSTGGALSGTPDLQVDADGGVAARTSLTVPTATLSGNASIGGTLTLGIAATNTALSVTNGNVVISAGTLTLSRAAGSNALVISSANASIGGSLAVTGAISGAALSGTSLNVGAGTITSGAITSSGAISGTGLNIGSGTANAGSFSGTSVNVNQVNALGGGNAVYAPSGNIFTGGALNASGAVSAGGALSGTSLNVGAGSITSGPITSSGAISGTSLNVGGGAVNAGAISGTSLTTSAGSVSTAASVLALHSAQYIGFHNNGAAAGDYSFLFDTANHVLFPHNGTLSLGGMTVTNSSGGFASTFIPIIVNGVAYKLSLQYA